MTSTNGFQTWWGQRDTREKTLITAAAVLVSLALVWLVGMAPALKTLRQFDASRSAQQAQLQTLRTLQLQAQTLQSQPHINASAARQALKTATDKAFGTQADISISNGNVTANLRNVSPDALAQWLASARSNAHATPVQMRITRSATVNTAGGTVGWSGSVQLTLPAD